jgi:hypothetical protein
VISLTLGGVVAWLNASRSVRTEMRSAMLVGRRPLSTRHAASTSWWLLSPATDIFACALSERRGWCQWPKDRPSACCRGGSYTSSELRRSPSGFRSPLVNLWCLKGVRLRTVSEF